jgi:ABC-type branched-subunit amino acid transport system ATPase component
VSPGAASEASVSRLFERDGELAAVTELLELAEVGSGRVLLVLGPAGIGKTGLLTATSGMARAAGCRVCEAALKSRPHGVCSCGRLFLYPSPKGGAFSTGRGG